MKQAVDMLLNPIVKVVEEDCGTLLGSVVDTGLELQGFTEVATKEPLDIARINQLLTAGQYRTGIRTLHTCQSYKLGGVCRRCLSASLFTDTDLSVGETSKIPSLIVYQTDMVRGNGYTTTFPLSETSDDWYEVVVIKQGMRLSEGVDYSLGFDSITFPTAMTVDSETSVVTVHFMKQNSDPFLGYISKTYSGALLGMLPLPSLPTLLRESLYDILFSDNFVGLLLEDLEPLKAIPSTYRDYLDRVHGKMEKVLLALFLYSIYGNVEI